jgi:hypothetical protein
MTPILSQSNTWTKSYDKNIEACAEASTHWGASGRLDRASGWSTATAFPK